MKTHTLILSIALASLAVLGGPALAEDEQTLRQDLKADARHNLRVAGSDMLTQALASLRDENRSDSEATRRPELPARGSLILVAEAAAEIGPRQGASLETAPVLEESILGGLVVYSGNR
jgi:hypothetical protein